MICFLSFARRYRSTSSGQPCQDDTSCVMSDYCAFVDGGETCEPRIANGTSCAPDSDGCLTGSYCDTTQTCVAGLPSGAACTTSQQCSGGSCVNGKCGGSNNLGLSLYCQ